MKNAPLSALVISLAVLSGGLFLGCPSGSSGSSDGGEDGGEMPSGAPVITVSGRITTHPAAVAFLADAGVTFDVTGLTVRVEEPLLAALDPNDATAVFGTQSLDASGDFSVDQVRTDVISLGVAAGVRDESDVNLRCCPECGALADAGCVFVPNTRVVRTATVVWDVIFKQGTKPEENLVNTKGYALPSQFHAKLNAAVGPERILSLTAQRQASLVGAGFALGRVVDAAGNPVTGAKISSTDMDVVSRVFYPTADLATVNTTGTSSNGLFIYVFNGEDTPKQFPFTVEGKSEYRLRKAGAAKGGGLLLTVFPGDNEP